MANKPSDKEKPVISTSGFEIKPVYGPEDLDDFDPAEKLGEHPRIMVVRTRNYQQDV